MRAWAGPIASTSAASSTTRSTARAPGATLFDGPADYQQFEEVLAEATARRAMRLLAYCLMPNHWHLVLWPEQDGARPAS